MTTAAPLRYVPARLVAAACGLPLSVLDNRHRPDSWGAPRNVAWLQRELHYAEDGLPQLVSALFQAGETDAAIKLRDWCAQRAVILASDPAPHWWQKDNT